MEGIDKILEAIEQEARVESGDLLREAEEKAYLIKEAAEQEAIEGEKRLFTYYDTLAKRLEEKEKNHRIQEKKKSLLAFKQDTLIQTFEKTLHMLLELDTATYFQVIQKMIAYYGRSEQGDILFSERDLQRLPKSFQKQIEKALHTKPQASLKISELPASIEGGFILRYGQIEENCSFQALLEANKEKLQDSLTQLYFG